MKVSILEKRPLRIVTHQYFLPVVLSILLNACSKGPSDLTATSLTKTPSETIHSAEILDFSIREGLIYNQFFRQGPVAAHTVLTSGIQPRLVVAFPAGNSGVSLWFKTTESEVHWRTVDAVQGVSATNRDGELLYGIESEVTVDAAQLVVEKAVLSNVRVIRDYLHTREVPDAIQSELSIDGRTATWYRDRLDGRGGYELAIEVLQGSLVGDENASVVFRAPPDQALRLRVVALSGDKPLTPIGLDALLTPNAVDDPLARNILAFLSYREKLLAGSWRFCTYFGRDTLMSIRLLMPALTATTIEAGVGSVLARLNADGEVAHEEDIGEFAVLRRGGEGPNASHAPLYDYHMVDDDFLLAPIVAHYFLDHVEGRTRASAFLQQQMAHGQSYGEALVSNIRFVLGSARPFAREPNVNHLIKLKDGSPAGQWRDSREGLGHGRIAYDVNAVFVPAALTAIARLDNSGLLAEYMAEGDSFAQSATLAERWTNNAPPLFSVTVPYERALQDVADYAVQIGVSDQDALASFADERVAGQAGITFNAVSLDAEGRAIPILNSDDGFAMLFGNLSVAELERSVTALFRPFPAGLFTPVGLVVANPVFAPQEQRQLFTNNHYHGAVVWSWHQALLAAGLKRQLQRTDLPTDTRQHLIDAQTQLWRVIASTNATKNSELWSWSYEQGEYRLEPFGQRSGDETESNAAQLWSTVYLAISRP